MDSVNEIDESGTHLSQNGSFRVCRTINCGRHAPTEDDFCPRCREEIDAVRDMARRRFVMRDASAIRRAAERLGIPRSRGLTSRTIQRDK
jgi:hypothetical protein